MESGALGIPLTEKILDNIGKDVRGSDRAWMLSLGTPWPLKLGRDPVTLSKNLERVRCAYIFCTQSGDPVDEYPTREVGQVGRSPQGDRLRALAHGDEAGRAGPGHARPDHGVRLGFLRSLR